VEWNIGEAAGLLASSCVHRGTEPNAVAEQRALFDRWARFLDAEGVEGR